MNLLDDLYQEASAADQLGEDIQTPTGLDSLDVDSLFALLAQAEREARRWRTVKTLLDRRMAASLEGRKIRYGDTFYRSKRESKKIVPEEVRHLFAQWVAEGGEDRVTQLFNPNNVRYGQLRDLDYVDVVTGEIQSAFKAFVDETPAKDAPWSLESMPLSRAPKYAQTMPEGEIQ